MPLGYFLCGCKIGPRRGYSRRVVGGEKKIVGDVEVIFGGIEVCPEHGDFPWGYLSPSKRGPQGNIVTDYSKMGSGTMKSLELNPESVARQVVLRSLDEQAARIAKNRKRRKNGAIPRT